MQHRAAGQTRTQAGLNKLTCLPTSSMGVAIVCSVNRLDTFIKHIQKLSSCLQVCGHDPVMTLLSSSFVN